MPASLELVKLGGYGDRRPGRAPRERMGNTAAYASGEPSVMPTGAAHEAREHLARDKGMIRTSGAGLTLRLYPSPALAGALSDGRRP